MGFSRGESYGFIILLPLVVILVISQPITKWLVTDRTDDFSRENQVLDSLVKLIAMPKGGVHTASSRVQRPGKEATFFDFDPNKVSSAALNQLGFSEKIADRILKYRSKGGKFRIKSDMLKIYGMDSTLYKNLYDFILLPAHAGFKEQNTLEFSKHAVGDKKVVEKSDLNRADTVQLESIYGIGPTLARRIVKYRLRLGGFISTNQLKEVYGLDSTVINSVLKVFSVKSDFDIAKLNINTLMEKELQTHPYINRAVAKAIVTYRFQHGNFKNVEEIRNLLGIKTEVIDRLIPYLKVND